MVHTFEGLSTVSDDRGSKLIMEYNTNPALHAPYGAEQCRDTLTCNEDSPWQSAGRDCKAWRPCREDGRGMLRVLQ